MTLTLTTQCLNRRDPASLPASVQLTSDKLRETPIRETQLQLENHVTNPPRKLWAMAQNETRFYDSLISESRSFFTVNPKEFLIKLMFLMYKPPYNFTLVNVSDLLAIFPFWYKMLPYIRLTIVFEKKLVLFVTEKTNAMFLKNTF